MLIKLYGATSESAKVVIARQSASARAKRESKAIPISITFRPPNVERSNLTVRMHTRRFTRLTNAFSKKVENHAHSVALFAMYYNFVRIHKTLRTTPAMAASVTSRLWEIGDIIEVLEAWELTRHARHEDIS